MTYRSDKKAQVIPVHVNVHMTHNVSKTRARGSTRPRGSSKTAGGSFRVEKIEKDPHLASLNWLFYRVATGTSTMTILFFTHISKKKLEARGNPDAEAADDHEDNREASDAHELADLRRIDVGNVHLENFNLLDDVFLLGVEILEESLRASHIVALVQDRV